MYTVTCPACGFAIELPFARRGAAGRCPACGKVVPVDETTLNGRRPREAADAPSLDPETPRVDADGNVIGLSGLSYLLDQAGAQGARPAQGRPSAPTHGSRAAGSRRSANRPPPAPLPRSFLLGVVVAVAAVGLLGLAIWYVTRPNHSASPPSPPAEASPAAPADP